MKRLPMYLLPILLVVGCGGGKKSESSSNTTEQKAQQTATVEQTQATAQSEQVSEFGVGPIQEPLNLPETIDEALAKKGQELFDKKGCTACHELDKKKVGPPLRGVTDQRPPEWIMNMIMNPDEMILKDPVAQKLLEEYGVPMTNQNVSKDEARAILEFLRKAAKEKKN